MPARTLAAGAPAKIRSQLSVQATEWVERSGSHYAELSRSYLAQGIGRLDR